MKIKANRIKGIHPLSFLLFIALISSLMPGCGGESGGSFGIFDPETGVSVTLSWIAPVTNEDGSSLTDLAGYNVHYGETSGVYTDVVKIGNSTNCSIGSLPVGKLIYFAVTAFDTYGNESSFSNEVSAILAAK